MNKNHSSRWWKQSNLGTKCIEKWKSLKLIRNTLLCLMHKTYHKKTILENRKLNLNTRACGWCRARSFQRLICWTTKRSINCIILEFLVVVIAFWTRLITCRLLWTPQKNTTHVLKALWSSFIIAFHHDIPLKFSWVVCYMCTTPQWPYHRNLRCYDSYLHHSDYSFFLSRDKQQK